MNFGQYFRTQDKKINIFYIGIIAIIAAIVGAIVFSVALDQPMEIYNSFFKKGKTKTVLEIQSETASIVKGKDFSECEKIKDDLYKTVCVNNIALNLAKEKQDISYCEKVDNAFIPRKSCEQDVILPKSINKEDIAVCQETKDAELRVRCQNSFYTQLALKKGDIKICDKEKNKDVFDTCFDTYKVENDFTKNAAAFDCQLLRGSQARDDCSGVKKNMAELLPCPRLGSGLFQSYCRNNR